MDRIPVKIVNITSPGGETARDIMLDVRDYSRIGNAQEHLKKFKEKYFETVRAARGIIPGDRSERKPGHFWQAGRMLYRFNKSERRFEIRNYNSAVAEDLGLYDASHVGNIVKFGEFFDKKDVNDKISMSVYVELIWKADLLNRRGLLAGEKRRLVQMAKGGTVPGHKEYREELNRIVSSASRTG